jgi:hypothetical protein
MKTIAVHETEKDKASKLVDAAFTTTSGSAIGAVAGVAVSGITNAACAAYGTSALTTVCAILGTGALPVFGSVIGGVAGLLLGTIALRSHSHKRQKKNEQI